MRDTQRRLVEVVKEEMQMVGVVCSSAAGEVWCSGFRWQYRGRLASTVGGHH